MAEPEKVVPKAVLNLHLTVDDAHVVECAEALHQRLEPNQWRILATLAAEIVARWESAAAGSRLLVVPMADLPTELHRAVQAAGLPVPE